MLILIIFPSWKHWLFTLHSWRKCKVVKWLLKSLFVLLLFLLRLNQYFSTTLFLSFHFSLFWGVGYFFSGEPCWIVCDFALIYWFLHQKWWCFYLSKCTVFYEQMYVFFSIFRIIVEFRKQNNFSEIVKGIEFLGI